MAIWHAIADWTCLGAALAGAVAMACAKVQPEVPAQPIRKRPRPTKLYIILGSVAYAGAAYFIFTEAAPQFIWFSLTCLALGAAVHSIRARSKRREIESRVRIAAFISS